MLETCPTQGEINRSWILIVYYIWWRTIIFWKIENLTENPRFGCKGQIHAVFFTELTWLSDVSGPDPCFEGEYGALESRGNWPALSTGQGLCGAKGFSPPGMPTPAPSGPATQAQRLSFVAALPWLSALNQSPSGARRETAASCRNGCWISSLRMRGRGNTGPWQPAQGMWWKQNK